MKQLTYLTVQMNESAPGGKHCIHLARTDIGGLGPNICLNSRHALSPITGKAYGLSANGTDSTDSDAWPCAGCLLVLDRNPGEVDGTFAHLFPPDRTCQACGCPDSGEHDQ